MPADTRAERRLAYRTRMHAESLGTAGCVPRSMAAARHVMHLRDLNDLTVARTRITVSVMGHGMRERVQVVL
jgi:hypothetical protein